MYLTHLNLSKHEVSQITAVSQQRGLDLSEHGELAEYGELHSPDLATLFSGYKSPHKYIYHWPMLGLHSVFLGKYIIPQSSVS